MSLARLQSLVEAGPTEFFHGKRRVELTQIGRGEWSYIMTHDDEGQPTGERVGSDPMPKAKAIQQAKHFVKHAQYKKGIGYYL